MGKRKIKDLERAEVVEEPRRSSRRKSTRDEPAPDQTNAPIPLASKPKKSKKAAKGGHEEGPAANDIETNLESKPGNPTKPPEVAPIIPESSNSAGRQYWLMKAEPESRIEKGHDIKFSIDDLASKTVPEPWDGIRAYAARNNLRAMKKGDLAFFYHSSCKIPAIVGVMEIVEEHTPDLSAHNSSAPYYDASSTPSNPKWSVVHVEFRQKLGTPVTLKEMKAWYGEKGHPLENMQMLKLARMSVSKVSAGEWEFLVGEMAKRGDVVKL